jgi:hypothetical protein
MMLAFGTAIVVAGSAVAQAPDALTPVPAPAVVDSGPPHAAPWFASASNGNADGQFWLSGEYVVGWFKGDSLPALVTTSPAGTPRGIAGIPGPASTRVLFGGETVNDDLRSGIRLGAGYWFTPARECGIEVGFMMIENQASGFAGVSDGSTILARPFIDANTNTPQAALIAFPGSSGGGVAARIRSGDFYDGHIDLMENVFNLGWVRFDSLFGYRFYRYDEGLRVRQTVLPTGVGVATGSQIDAVDNFSAQNEFHGGDFGFRTQFTRDTFSLDLLTKCAVGSVNRDVKIFGGQVFTSPGSAPVPAIGGLLALGSNIGAHHSHDWALLPEFGATLGWRASDNVRVTFGYSALFLERIARAADQIDLHVNPNLFPGTGQSTNGVFRPNFLLVRNDAWFQTLSLGIEFSY